MKRKLIPFIAVIFVFFSGCKSETDGLAAAMELRSRLLSSAGCRFVADVTADYGERMYSFVMDCQAEADGTLSFTVAEPESIAGISGKVGQSGGKLTFNDTALAFELLADEQFSPVSAPWLLVHMLRSGYLTCCTETEYGWMISIDDYYDDDKLSLNVYLDTDGLPAGAEISWRGRRILSLTVKNFNFL